MNTLFHSNLFYFVSLILQCTRMPQAQLCLDCSKFHSMSCWQHLKSCSLWLVWVLLTLRWPGYFISVRPPTSRLLFALRRYWDWLRDLRQRMQRVHRRFERSLAPKKRIRTLSFLSHARIPRASPSVSKRYWEPALSLYESSLSDRACS